MSEQYVNLGVSTSAGSINNSSNPVTFSVQTGDGTLFPGTTNGSFRVTVANADGTNAEVMLCTSRTADSLTCSRGSSATLEVPIPTLLAHNSGSIVSHDITSGAMSQIRADLSNSNTDSNLPTAAVSHLGDLFFASDYPYFTRYDGSIFHYWGPVYASVPVIAGNFSWQNQNGTHYTGTVISGNGAYLISQTTDASGATAISSQSKNVLASKSFTATWGFNLLQKNTSGHCGPFVSDGTQYILMGIQANGPNQIRTSLYTSATTYSSDYFGPASINPSSGPYFMRIKEDASNRTYYMSLDNVNWFQIFQHAVTTGFTSTKYGFAVESRSGVNDVQAMEVFHFNETNP